MWGCVEFVIAGWSGVKMKMLWLKSLRLEEAMRILACGNQ